MTLIVTPKSGVACLHADRVVVLSPAIVVISCNEEALGWGKGNKKEPVLY